MREVVKEAIVADTGRLAFVFIGGLFTKILLAPSATNNNFIYLPF